MVKKRKRTSTKKHTNQVNVVGANLSANSRLGFPLPVKQISLKYDGIYKFNHFNVKGLHISIAWKYIFLVEETPGGWNIKVGIIFSASANDIQAKIQEFLKNHRRLIAFCMRVTFPDTTEAIVKNKFKEVIGEPVDGTEFFKLTPATLSEFKDVILQGFVEYNTNNGDDDDDFQELFGEYPGQHEQDLADTEGGFSQLWDEIDKRLSWFLGWGVRVPEHRPISENVLFELHMKEQNAVHKLSKCIKLAQTKVVVGKLVDDVTAAKATEADISDDEAYAKGFEQFFEKAFKGAENDRTFATFGEKRSKALMAPKLNDHYYNEQPPRKWQNVEHPANNFPGINPQHFNGGA